MNGRRRGGADVEMEGELNISDVSDADILAEIGHRRLGLKILEQYDFMADLPTIPDASSPQAFCTQGLYYYSWAS